MDFSVQTIYMMKYVLTFLDGEFEFCDSIEDTFCSGSATGEIEDVFLKKENNIYLFQVFENKCFIKNCTRKESQQEIENKKWIQTIVNNCFQNKLLINNCSKQSQIIFLKNEKEYFFLFFIQHFNLYMKRSLFQKIKQNTISIEQQFTTEELFFIIYSYAFSILDNRFKLLENILILISKDEFEISELNEYFTHFATKQFKVDIAKSDVENFLANNHQEELLEKTNSENKIFQNMNLKKVIHNWKQSLKNVLQMLKITFSINIEFPHHNHHLIIQNENTTVSKVLIPIKNLDNIIFLIHEECIFIIKAFEKKLFDIILMIVKKSKNIKIKMNIIECFKSMYGKNQNFIEDANKILEEFFHNMKHYSNCQIIFIFGYFDIENEIVFEKYNSEYSEDDFYLLFITSRYISSFPLLTKNCLILWFSEKIIESFYNITSCSLKSLDIFNEVIRETSTNPSNIDHGYSELVQHLDIKYFDGENSKEQNILLGINNYSTYFKLYHQITGFYDGNYSIFELISNSLSSYMSGFFRYITSSKRTQLMNYSQSVQYSSKRILIYESCDFLVNEPFHFVFIYEEKHCIDSINQPRNKHLLMREMINSLKSDTLKFFFSQIALHHFTNTSLETKTKNYQLSPFCNFQIRPSFLPFFKIDNSNFHIIILRFLEVSSILKTGSTLEILYEKKTHVIKIVQCEITFFGNTPNYITKLIIYDSIILGIFEISLFDHDHLNLEISTSIFEILIQKELKIQPKNSGSQGVISLILENTKINLELYNFRIYILDHISHDFNLLKFNKCDIQAHADSLYLNTLQKYQMNEEKESEKHGITTISQLFDKRNKYAPNLLIQNSFLPKTLHIKDNFNSVQIEECSGSIILSNEIENIKIDKHQGSISILDKIMHAQFRSEKGIFNKTKNLLVFKLLNIAKLQNIDVENLILSSCFISNIENVYTNNLNIDFIKCEIQILYNSTVVMLHPRLRNSFIRKNERCLIIKDFETIRNSN